MDNLAAENRRILVIDPSPEDAERLKDRVLRLRRFADWLTEKGLPWYAPDLGAYSRYLRREWELAPTSIKAHVSTVRARYQELLDEKVVERELLRLVSDAPQAEQTQFLMRNEGRIKLELGPLAAFTRMQSSRAEHQTLTRKEAFELLRRPGTGSPTGLRDTAIIAVFLGTGIRPIELTGLRYDDVYQYYGAQQALRIPGCRGCTERTVPYIDWRVWDIVKQWLGWAHVDGGPVFRGFYRGNNLRDGPMSRRAVEQVLKSYPIKIDGRTHTVNAMVLRRTYARWLYEAGSNLRVIRQHLGVKSLDTVEQYIGDTEVAELDVGFERIFDLSQANFEK